VLAVIEALSGGIVPLDLGDDAWLPADDPHRAS
jgi:hypothetical protein